MPQTITTQGWLIPVGKQPSEVCVHGSSLAIFTGTGMGCAIELKLRVPLLPAATHRSQEPIVLLLRGMRDGDGPCLDVDTRQTPSSEAEQPATSLPYPPCK